MLKIFNQNNKKSIISEIGGRKMNQKTKKITKRFECDEKITSPHPQPFSLMRRREKSAAFTLLVKPFRSNPLTALLCSRRSRFSLTKFRNCVAHSYGFTLAETLITVVILGILAAILVPNLIKNQVENANRTKVKKAMAAYEKAINYMIIENDIKSTEALRELGQNNCQYTREYFKTVQDGSNNCIFKTADRVWWDITDITNPLISLKDEITDANVAAIANNALSLNADSTSFALIGRFDEVGTLRVNDNAYEQGLSNNLTNQAYMIKLWHFINNSDNFSAKEQFATCKATRVNTCTISVNGVNTTYSKIVTNTDTAVVVNGNPQTCIYNRETKTQDCSGYTSIATAGEYWLTENLGAPTTAEATSEEICALSKYPYCSTSGDYYEVSRLRCEKSGGHLATLAELEIARINGKLDRAAFWAAEEYNRSNAYRMHKNGSVSNFFKDSSSHQILCVGNN